MLSIYNKSKFLYRKQIKCIQNFLLVILTAVFFFTKQNELFAFRQNETSLTLHMLHIVEICFNCGKDSNLV